MGKAWNRTRTIYDSGRVLYQNIMKNFPASREEVLSDNYDYSLSFQVFLTLKRVFFHKLDPESLDLWKNIVSSSGISSQDESIKESLNMFFSFINSKDTIDLILTCFPDEERSAIYDLLYKYYVNDQVDDTELWEDVCDTVFYSHNINLENDSFITMMKNYYACAE